MQADPGSGSLSVSFAFWIDPSVVTGDTVALVSKGNYRSWDPGWRFFAAYDASQEQWALYFRAMDVTLQDKASATKYLGSHSVGTGGALGKWFHVTGVIDRWVGVDKVRLYLNNMYNPQIGGGAGAPDEQLTDGTAISSPEPLMIGWARGTDTVTWAEHCPEDPNQPETYSAKERQFMRGYVDDVRIYPRVLSRSPSNDEVTQSFEAWDDIDFREIEVYRMTSDYCYRIPAIARHPQTGDLYAFAERRHRGFWPNPCDDAGNHDIVVRRSTDDGRSWERKDIVVVDSEQLREELIPQGDDGFAAATNPSPVFDAEGRLLLFYNVVYNTDFEDRNCSEVPEELKYLQCFHSEYLCRDCRNQEGRIHTDNLWDRTHVFRLAQRKVVIFSGGSVEAGFVQDITSQLEDGLSTNLRWHAFGPGHSIVVDSATNVVGVPVYHTYWYADDVRVGPTTVMYYDAASSDPEDITFAPLQQDISGCPASCGASELQVAKLSDQTLVINARRTNKTCATSRREFTLVPDATEWVGMQVDDLRDPVSHGSIIALPTQELATAHSACYASQWLEDPSDETTECKGHRFRKRRNMTVHIKDEFDGWSQSAGRVVRKGSSGYPDLVDMSDVGGRLGLLYEAPRGDARGGWVYFAEHGSYAGAHLELCDSLPTENSWDHVRQEGQSYYEHGISFAMFTRDWVLKGDDGAGNPSPCDDTTFFWHEMSFCEHETALQGFAPTDVCLSN